jgi:hypothetical protein
LTTWTTNSLAKLCRRDRRLQPSGTTIVVGKSGPPWQKYIPLTQNRDKDAEFSQRQQTANRNLCSNTWKVYLKQLRDLSSETHLNLAKIIQRNSLAISLEQFMSHLNRHFPPSTTYISSESVRRACGRAIKLEYSEEADNFAKLLRISICRFYTYEIYAVNIKSIRTTRKIRNQQIKQGKIFVRELFV